MNASRNGEASMAPRWHTLRPAEALQRFETDASRGLDPAEAAARLQRHGPNLIVEQRRRSLAGIFASQFRDFMIIVLLAAALVSGFVGEAQDTIAIVVIVLLNAVIGAVQEYRAERAVAALRALAAPVAEVLRAGERLSVETATLVPGDIVLLETGASVPADLRLLEAKDLQTDESALTGESRAVEKAVEPLADADLPIGDRCNLAFKGSLVSRGHGSGVVVASGMGTEIGRIAELLRSEEGVKTPLQRRLARFGRYLALAILAICAIVFVTGLLQGQPALLMFLTAVSLAVAAIPEALPAVVTVSLAFGARKLSRHNALVRRLPAVETLGSVTYICADKTGTLTQNRMHAELFLAGGERRQSLPAADGAASPWREFGLTLALNNDVALRDGEPSGEPTELALHAAAVAAGFDKQDLQTRYPRVAEIAFDSTRKLMSTVHDFDGQTAVLVKGAPEAILHRCTDALVPGGSAALDRDVLLAEAASLAAEGYRVLAFARRGLAASPESLDAEHIECELSFVGLVALIDPPRPEVPAAVAECREAGITPVMITGDHPATASAIAERLGMLEEHDRVLTGAELTQLSDEELATAVRSVRVYARVSPEQKTQIVKALQANGEFVAMTGDGVNDAPALKRAGIGVAMGQRGTDVAREAADMVLLDDNFATIVGAVAAGRRVFDNIRKFIKYTMSSNSGEIWTLFLAPFFGLPVPLLPIHILWINLVTDGLPGLAFTTERAEPGTMRRPPRPPEESIFAHGMWQHILWVGLLVGGLSIASQAWSYARGAEYWQTMVFTVLTLSQLFHAMVVRSERASLFSIGVASNRAMLGAVLLTLGLQMAVIYVPVLNVVFHTQPLPPQELAACFLLSSLVLVAVEIEKWLVRRGLIYRPAAPAR
jgi:Ca2+-transporting ATPase